MAQLSRISPEIPSRAHAILAFWFMDNNGSNYGKYSKTWFTQNADFDQQIRQKFFTDYEKASVGDYDQWIADPESAIALIILLDQFPRNLFRNDPRSYSSDDQALSIAKHLVTIGADRKLIAVYRLFIYMPFEHSENIEDQEQCIALMTSLIKDEPELKSELQGSLEYAIRHRDVIERFGRFPHRNTILGRQSTDEEIEFLKLLGSGF